jgi:hypothetical protein
MIPHDDKGLGGNCHRDTARLLLLSIAQAVECNAEGDRYVIPPPQRVAHTMGTDTTHCRYFRQERYHEALQHYLSATIKLMPWDTSVLSLGLSNSSGFFDASVHLPLSSLSKRCPEKPRLTIPLAENSPSCRTSSEQERV